MPDYYLLEDMDSHLFQLVKSSGEVLGKVDLLCAEGIEHRMRKNNLRVEWVDRGAIKERKHVRNLISQYKVAGSSQLLAAGNLILRHGGAG